MNDFTLHPRLAADTSFVADWPLCRVLLMNEARYFWLVLVPRLNDVTEITELSPADRAQLMEEAARAGAIIRAGRASPSSISAPWATSCRNCICMWWGGRRAIRPGRARSGVIARLYLMIPLPGRPASLW